MAQYTVWVEAGPEDHNIIAETDDLHDALRALSAAAALVSGGATGVGMDIGAAGGEEQQPAGQHQHDQAGQQQQQQQQQTGQVPHPRGGAQTRTPAPRGGAAPAHRKAGQ